MQIQNKFYYMSYWICIIIGTLLIVSIADVQSFLFKDIVGIKY